MMKILTTAVLALTLTACATTEPSADPSPASDASASADTVASSDPYTPSLPESGLATPPEAPADSPTPAPSTESTAAATPAPESTDKSPAEPSAAVASTPEALPPVVTGAGSSANQQRNIYQEYEEYKDRVKSRKQSEDDLDQRVLFAHEDGAFQLGLDYVFKPFEDYDFDSTTRAVDRFDTKGISPSFGFFPLRSFSYGRVGAVAQLGLYWTRFDGGANAKSLKSNKHSITTYGAKLVYEAQFWIGQLLVPFGYVGYDQVSVRQRSTSAGSTIAGQSFKSTHYGAGLNFNLNRLEPSSASKALANSGIRKFYLSYTYQQREQNTGAGHFLGLRFEY